MDYNNILGYPGQSYNILCFRKGQKCLTGEKNRVYLARTAYMYTIYRTQTQAHIHIKAKKMNTVVLVKDLIQTR